MHSVSLYVKALVLEACILYECQPANVSGNSCWSFVAQIYAVLDSHYTMSASMLLNGVTYLYVIAGHLACDQLATRPCSFAILRMEKYQRSLLGCSCRLGYVVKMQN